MPKRWFYCSVENCKRFYRHFKTKQALEDHAFTAHNNETLLDDDWRIEVVDSEQERAVVSDLEDAESSDGADERGNADARGDADAREWTWTRAGWSAGGGGADGRGDAAARGCGGADARERLRSRSPGHRSLVEFTSAELIAELKRRLAYRNRRLELMAELSRRLA